MAITSAIKGLIGGAVEQFESNQRTQNPSYTLSRQWIDFIVFIIVLLIIAFCGKFMWNTFLAGGPGVGDLTGEGFITVLKPLPTIWHAIAIYVVIGLFFGRSS